MKTEKVKQFAYTEEMVEVLAVALKKAVESTGCDPRSLDWFNYRPDQYRR